jgi:hypothetical protein
LDYKNKSKFKNPETSLDAKIPGTGLGAVLRGEPGVERSKKREGVYLGVDEI